MNLQTEPRQSSPEAGPEPSYRRRRVLQLSCLVERLTPVISAAKIYHRPCTTGCPQRPGPPLVDQRQHCHPACQHRWFSCRTDIKTPHGPEAMSSQRHTSVSTLTCCDPSRANVMLHRQAGGADCDSMLISEVDFARSSMLASHHRFSRLQYQAACRQAPCSITRARAF